MALSGTATPLAAAQERRGVASGRGLKPNLDARGENCLLRTTSYKERVRMWPLSWFYVVIGWYWVEVWEGAKLLSSWCAEGHNGGPDAVHLNGGGKWSSRSSPWSVESVCLLSISSEFVASTCGLTRESIWNNQQTLRLVKVLLVRHFRPDLALASGASGPSARKASQDSTEQGTIVVSVGRHGVAVFVFLLRDFSSWMFIDYSFCRWQMFFVLMSLSCSKHMSL